MVTFDHAAFRAINGLAGRSRLGDAVGGFCGRWLIWLLFAYAAWLAVRQFAFDVTSLWGMIYVIVPARALFAALAAFGFGWMLESFFRRPRPFVAHQGARRIIPAPPTHFSFPSGHASSSFALAVTLLLAQGAGFVSLGMSLAFLGCAFLVAFGRVFVGVHYPADVVAGAALGTLVAVAVTYLHLL